jgi:peptidoglycan hydrolase CwlO-like protein
MEELTIPTNPTLNYIIFSVASAVIALVGNFLLKKSDNNTKVEVARINSSEREVEKLTQDLQDLERKIQQLSDDIISLKESLTAKGKVIMEKDKIVYQLEELLKRFKILFDITYKQLKVVLKDNQDGLVVLEEVKKTFDEHSPGR